jgi:hypothetical protein
MRIFFCSLTLWIGLFISPSSRAEGLDRTKQCLSSEPKTTSAQEYCKSLEKELVKIEAEVQAARKDKSWRAVCLEYAPGGCVPELDLDQDGKADRVYLMEKGQGKKKRRMIAVSSSKGGLKLLEKSKDMELPASFAGDKFDLSELTGWSVGSTDDELYKLHLSYCSMKPGSKVLELFLNGSYSALTTRQGNYCYIIIGD